MSWRRTILAGLTFVALVLVYTLDLRIAQNAVVQAVNEQSLAPGVNKSEVVEVKLHNLQGDVLLARDRGQWRVKSPVEAAADPEIVDQLLINVTGARKRNELEVKKLSDYGLATPDISLSMKTESGKVFELQIGNESTYTGQVFAKFPKGKSIFTVGEHVKNVLVRSPLDFRRARLVDVDMANLNAYRSLSIQTPDKNVVLKNDAGNWRITSPVESPGEASIVQDYLRKSALLRATSFITENSDKPTSLAVALQALTSPTLMLTLEGAQGTTPMRLQVGLVQLGDHSVYVAKRLGDEEVMVVRHETVDALAQDENYFRSRSIFSMDPADVGLFSIEIGRQRTDLLLNDKGVWEMVGDPEQRVDQSQVQVRLEALLRGKVKNYVEASPRDLVVYGLLPPRFKFTVTSKDKTRTEGVETGRAETGNVTSVYARRRGDSSVFMMEMSSELVILPGNIADHHFARTAEELVDHLEIQVGEQKFALKKEKGEWKVLRPTQTSYAPVDITKMRRLLGFLNELEYQKDFRATGETVIAPVDSSPLQVHLYGQGDKDLLNFRVGKRLQTTTLVTTGKDRTYEVKSDDLDQVMAAVQSVLQ